MRILPVLAVFFCVFLCACGDSGSLNDSTSDSTSDSADVAPQRGPQVYTVNYPLAWLARELAGDSADIHFPAPDDGDPAFWKPEPGVIAQYQQADLILLNGAGYARWLAQASLPTSRLVDTSTTFGDQLLSVDSGPAHSHGPEGEHSHGELAFTVWLDPTLFAQQADAITRSLSILVPVDSGSIAGRLSLVQERLREWDAQLQAASEALAGRPILYSHPVYQYLQRRYSLNGVALHWEPDQVPASSAWTELEHLLKKHPAQIMLWEAVPPPEVVARLQGLGVASVVFAPQGAAPEEGSFADTMLSNIENLTQATQAITE